MWQSQTGKPYKFLPSVMLANYNTLQKTMLQKYKRLHTKVSQKCKVLVPVDIQGAVTQDATISFFQNILNRKCTSQQLLIQISLQVSLTYIPFWKNKRRLLRSPCCLSVYPYAWGLELWSQKIPVCVSVCVPFPIVARQLIGKHVPMATNPHATTELLAVFHVVHVISKENLCVCMRVPLYSC
jgi:hypothetical protein